MVDKCFKCEKPWRGVYQLIERHSISQSSLTTCYEQGLSGKSKAWIYFINLGVRRLRKPMRARRLGKYQDMVEDCRSNGWRAQCGSIEVGCTGFACLSLCETSSHVKKTIKNTSEADEGALKVALEEEE